MIRTWLAGKDQLDLISDDSFEFCFVVDFPMYEIDEETGETIFTHNPFSMPQGGMEALLTKDPTEVLAYQYDLVCNGIELASGAVRNHDVEIMKKAFDIAGYVGYERCVVTAGGVSLPEVSQKTMESKLVKGLFFAGELLDLDGDTGGYNLQIAFSTGRLAGQLKK